MLPHVSSKSRPSKIDSVKALDDYWLNLRSQIDLKKRDFNSQPISPCTIVWWGRRRGNNNNSRGSGNGMMAGPVTVTVVRYDSRAETDCCWCGVWWMMRKNQTNKKRVRGCSPHPHPSARCWYTLGVLYIIYSSRFSLYIWLVMMKIKCSPRERVGVSSRYYVHYVTWL